MTLHNLKDHVSWLLHARPRPSSRDAVSDTESSAAFPEPCPGISIASTTPIASAARNPRPGLYGSQFEQAFARPALPPSASGYSQEHRLEITNAPSAVSMARLAAVNRPKAQLVTQHQLATPASTTAPSSSLTATYTRSLSSATPQPANSTSRATGLASRQLFTPQTPRVVKQGVWRTPKPTLQVRDMVESLDLTGDDDSPSSQSFGDPEVLWSPAAAAQLGPSQPRGKKRKSDDIGGLRETKKGKSTEPVEEEFEDMDDFMDMDAMSDSGFVPKNAPPPYSINLPRGHVEDNGAKVLAQEVEDEATPRDGSLRGISDFQHSSMVQGSSSPLKRCKASNTSKPLTSQALPYPLPDSLSTRQEARRKAMVVMDSEDEEDVDYEDDGVANDLHIDHALDVDHVGSPARNTPDARGVPEKRARAQHAHPRSPCKQALQTASISQTCINAAYQRDLSINSVIAKEINNSSQSTPSSTIEPNDKKLLQVCLADASQLANALHVLERQLSDNGTLLTNLIEQDLPREAEKAERQVLVQRRKDLLQLRTTRELYLRMKDNHKALTDEVLARLDEGEDSSSQENSVAQSGKAMRDAEKQILRLLQDSRATSLGFGNCSDELRAPGSFKIDVPGTASSIESATLTPLRDHGRAGTIPENNTQVVMQTQPPPLSRYSESTLEKNLDQPNRFIAQTAPLSRHSTEQKQKPPWATLPVPPSEPSDGCPTDFEIEEELLLQEAESYRPEFPDNDDDEEFGNISDDDDEMLEAADDAETKRFNMNAKIQNSSRRTLSEIPSNSVAVAPKQIAPASDMYTNVDAVQGAFNFGWSHDLRVALKDRFRLTGFRHNQLEAMNATLGGKDVFVLMPTGGGKSLCYQLPAVIQSGRSRGVTIVVSPLLSLMQDQINHLRRQRIQAMQLTSETPAEHRRTILNGMRENAPEQFVQLLYLTPEALSMSNQVENALRNLYQRGSLARIVIDEAHCVSQWGHDFRQEYKALGQLREKFPGVPFMALTATATENCKMDVIHHLGMEGCKIFTQSFNRPNLFYEVRPKQNKAQTMDSIEQLITKKYKGQSGIIYTLSRKSCETIAADLSREYKIKAHHYHAGMEALEKARVQKAWQAGQYDVIVATIAFGMGIDKANVRYVIHYSLPKTLEGYYQETGRAGRDGKKSGCYLYYGYQDVIPLKSFIDKEQNSSNEQKMRQHKMLQRMVQYCQNNSDCRRVEILSYFNERFSRDDCRHSCDNCTSTSALETVDYTKLAQSAIQIVKKVTKNNQITVSQCADLLIKAAPKKDKQYAKAPLARRFEVEGMAELGSVTDMHKGEVEKIIYRLFAEQALQEYNKTNRAGFPTSYVELGSKYGDILKGRRPFKMQVRVSTASSDKNGRSAARSKTVKSGTGVAASSHNNNPPSTNVSSPVRGRNTKKKAVQQVEQRQFHDDDFEDDEYGYNGEDDFVVADDVDDDVDEYGIREVRDATRSKPRAKAAARLGPPITNDSRVDEADLPDLHQAVLDDFVDEAKKLDAQIRMEKGVKRPLFTDVQLREMAIRWTVTKAEILSIDGVDVDRAGIYASRFMPLVKRYHTGYEEMLAAQNDRDIDQNHRNVIDLCSDDDVLDEYMSDESGEQSGYFVPEAVRAFNEQLDYGGGLDLPDARADTPPPRPSQRPRGRSSGQGPPNWKKKSAKSTASSRSQSRASSKNTTASSGASRTKATGTKRKSGDSHGACAGAPSIMKKFGSSSRAKTAQKPGGINKFMAMAT